MSPLKEKAKALIDQLPEDAVHKILQEFVEDLEDIIDLEKAIQESNPDEAIEVNEFLRQLKAENNVQE